MRRIRPNLKPKNLFPSVPEEVRKAATKDYWITGELFKDCNPGFIDTSNVFIQHDVQVSTYLEREKFLRYLSSKVSITRFPRSHPSFSSI
jgi:hypothetical protein